MGHDRLKARLASVMRSIRAGEHGSIVTRRWVEWCRLGRRERALVMMPAGTVAMLRSALLSFNTTCQVRR